MYIMHMVRIDVKDAADVFPDRYVAWPEPLSRTVRPLRGPPDQAQSRRVRLVVRCPRRVRPFSEVGHGGVTGARQIVVKPAGLDDRGAGLEAPDVLALQVGAHAFHAALAAQPGLLEASKRLRDAHSPAVDPDLSGPYPGCDAFG